MKNYYITGASGFVGKNLITELLKQENIHIYGLFLPNETNLDFYVNDKITIVRGNILDYGSIYDFISQGDGDKIVVHVAGVISVYKNNDEFAFRANTEGTKNLVDASVKLNVNKFIYISSVDSLTKHKPGEYVAEQSEYYPDELIGVYSKSKAIANNYILKAYKENGLPAVICCPSAIAGPNDPFSAPINQAIKKFLNKKMPAVVKGGYDIVDVRDVVNGIIGAINNGRNGESYILAGTPISVLDLMAIAAKEANMKPVKMTVPHFIIKLISPFIVMHAKLHHKRPLFTSFSMDCLKQNPIYSHEKSSKELGYKSRPLEETIRDLIEWFRN